MIVTSVHGTTKGPSSYHTQNKVFWVDRYTKAYEKEKSDMEKSERKVFKSRYMS